jgi:hypothetical protein
MQDGVLAENFERFQANVDPCASPCDFIREPNETRRVPAPSHLAQRDVAKTFSFPSEAAHAQKQNQMSEVIALGRRALGSEHGSHQASRTTKQ